MDNSAQESRRARLGKIAQMCRARGSESDWYALLGQAARSLGVRPAVPPLPNRSDPALFFDFLGQTLERAAFPYKSKRHLALGSDIGTKDQAWNPEWIHRHLIDQLGILFADLLREIGDCRLPIFIGATAATRLFRAGTPPLLSGSRKRLDSFFARPGLQGVF